MKEIAKSVGDKTWQCQYWIPFLRSRKANDNGVTDFKFQNDFCKASTD